MKMNGPCENIQLTAILHMEEQRHGGKEASPSSVSTHSMVLLSYAIFLLPKERQV